MTLAPGGRLGPYEIVAVLGAGGMGEVYKARDPRLNRDVAIKTLPAAAAADADLSTLREPQGRPERGRGTSAARASSAKPRPSRR